jgi:hypothetical protein
MGTPCKCNQFMAWKSLILSYPLCTGLQSGLIHSGLLSGSFYAFLILTSMLHDLPTPFFLIYHSNTQYAKLLQYLQPSIKIWCKLTVWQQNIWFLWTCLTRNEGKYILSLQTSRKHSPWFLLKQEIFLKFSAVLLPTESTRQTVMFVLAI